MTGAVSISERMSRGPRGDQDFFLYGFPNLYGMGG